MMILILESALRSLMMAALVWAALRLLRVRHVIAQKIAWTLVLAVSIAMPLVSQLPAIHFKPLVALPSLRIAAPAAITRAAVASPINTSPVTTSAILHITPFTNPEEAAPSSMRWTVTQLRALIPPVYLAICSVLLMRLLFGLALAFRVWTRAQRASALIDPRATVRVSADIGTPSTIGSGIVLPKSFASWDPTKLRIVLAHERSHVRQGDFYLQLLARLYAAIFWFSPLAWWLQSELTDLGEAISDRAALEEAANRPSYAELLLEFASMPRRPLVGVAMARSSRIQRRIDRLVTDRLFRQAFAQRRLHAFAAVAVVLVAGAASASLVTVRAAENTSTPIVLVKAHSIAVSTATAAKPSAAPVEARNAVLTASTALSSPQTSESSSSAVSYLNENGYHGDQNSFAIVSAEPGHTVSFNADTQILEKARSKLHGNYIVFERNGKAYFIDDAALVAESQQLIKPMEELGRQQEALGRKQEQLGEEQERLGKLQEEATVPTPDMSKEIASLQAAIAKFQSLQKGQQLDRDALADLQNRIGDLQGRLGGIEGELGKEQGKFGEQQGKLGAQQGELGAQQGRLGAEQGKLSQDVSQKMKSLIDQAVQSGRTKPIE